MSAYDPLHFTRAAAHRPQKRQTLSNWGPLHSIVRSQGHRPQHHATNGFSAMNQQRNDGHHANHVTKDRLFGACGRAPSGSIVEFRFGIEASLRDGILFPSERIDLGGASNIFALSVHGKLPFFIVSYPWKSTWCSIETVPPNDSPAYLEHLPELDAPAQTLAAAVILAIANANDFIDEKQAKDGATKARRMVVQVTNSEIINVYFDRAEGKLCKVATLLFEKPTTATINARTGMILCISPSPSGCVLKLYEPSGKEILPSQSRQLDFICTAAAFLHPEGTSSQITHILLGTEAGSIELLEIVGDGQLQKKKRVLGLSSDDRGMGIESLGTVRGEEGCMFVLAGRRDGSIVVAQLGEDDKDDHEPTVSQVGDEPVSILGPLEGRRRILAISGNHIFAIDTPSTASGGHTQISEVFYTSPFDPAFRHGLLAGACIAEEAPGDYLAGRVIGLNGDGILCGVLDNGPKPVPIRTPVQGTPRLLASATDLQLLVYASTISHIDEEEGIRYSISTIFCMDPPSSQPQVKLEDGVADRLAFQISPGEEARCVAEMSMRVDEGTRSFILVGCSVLHEMDTDRGPRTVKGGSILWLKISRDSAGLRRISCSKRSEERGPVTALAPVNDASFVYASGRKVYGRSWNEETKRWPMRELQEMPSLVTAIRVDSEGGMLVTTAEHSTFVLQL